MAAAKGLFAKCHKNTLGKADTWQKSMHSEAKMASLPSVCAVTLDKEDMFAECQRLDTRRRNQKLGLEWPVFAECPGCDTRQTWFICRVSGPGHSANIHYLPSVRAGALGKQGHVCRVPRPLDTRQTRRDRLHAPLLFFCRALVSALGNVFAKCPIKNTRQINFCRHCVRRVLFAECNTPQSLCRVFFGLRRVPWTHGKPEHSGSGSSCKGSLRSASREPSAFCS